MSFFLLSAWHSFKILWVNTLVYYFFTERVNVLAGLNAGMLCSGMMIVVKKRAQKTARNISKNTTIIIPEHNIPAFKPAKTFTLSVKK
jgi:DNA-binding protein HU-beta